MCNCNGGVNSAILPRCIGEPCFRIEETVGFLPIQIGKILVHTLQFVVNSPVLQICICCKCPGKLHFCTGVSAVILFCAVVAVPPVILRQRQMFTPEHIPKMVSVIMGVRDSGTGINIPFIVIQ